MIDVNPDQLKTVVRILAEYVPQCEVRAFGSRVTWTAKDYSDLDLVVVGERTLDLDALSRLKEAFEESDLPFRVDVLDWHAIGSAFQRVIEKKYEVVRKSKKKSMSMASEWTVRPLEDCMAALIDYRGKTPEKTSFGIPLITAKVVKGGRIETPDEFIAIDDYEPWMRRGIPKAGDVVITTEAPLGEVAQLGAERVALAQRLIALRGKPGLLDNSFLKFLLQSEDVQDQLRARASGTTVLGIKQSELRKVSLTLPPIDEQHAIAHILGTLDDKIELNRRTNETLEAAAQALFKSWFVDFDPVRAKAEGRDPGLPKSLAYLFPDSFERSELGEIPKGWEVKKLSELCLTQYGYTASAVPEPVGPKFIRVTDINKRNWIEWADVPHCHIDDEKRAEYSLRVGDIVVARMADPGKSAIIEDEIDAIFASYLVRLKTESLAHSYYVYGFLKSELYLEYADGAKSGSVQANMNARVIVGADIVIPSRLLIERFLEAVLPLRKRLTASVRESHTLSFLRDTLLPKLVSGELRLMDAEPFVSDSKVM